jgi:hypothetical protein
MKNEDLIKKPISEAQNGREENTPKEDEIVAFDLVLKNYHDYLVKLPNWDWTAVMKKLRSLGIMTSRAEFVRIADESRSEFEASLALMKKHLATSKVTQENAPFVWAAANRLWQEFTPDYISLEDVVLELEFSLIMQDMDFGDLDLAPRFQDIDDYNDDPSYVLNNTILLWEDILNDIVGEGETETYTEANSWTIRWESWVEVALFSLYTAMMNAAEAEGKLSLKAFDLVQKLEETFTGMADESIIFAETKMWLAFVNGDAAAVDNWLARLLPHLDDEDKKITFEELGDWHKTPPVYAFTPADPVRAMFFYNKMLDEIIED